MRARAKRTYAAGSVAQPFATLGDLNHVLGMAPAIYARLSLSVSYQQDDPSPLAGGQVMRVTLAVSNATDPHRNRYPPEDHRGHHKLATQLT